MNIKYSLLTNSGVERLETGLYEFLLRFHFMFLAEAIPPYSVLSELCNSDPSDWGATSKIKWKPFSLEKFDYENVFEKLSSLNGFKKVEVPDFIDTAYKWSLWQYELKFGVPYSQYKKLADKERDFIKLINLAKEEGDKTKAQIHQIDMIDASNELNDFLSKYLN